MCASTIGSERGKSGSMGKGGLREGKIESDGQIVRWMEGDSEERQWGRRRKRNKERWRKRAGEG